MQGNSKYLRWSPFPTIACCCIFVILSSTVIAVPVRPRRMVTETYPTFDAINSNTISNVTCLKDGKEVLKSSVECEVKIGCKLIQKTGECCAEYQCDCSHEGVTYKNGERINNNDPCRRCLCKGGEVTCSEISCYIRDDCKPRYMKGVCCPTYDNCPPLDDAKIASSKESDQTASRITTARNDAIMSLTTVSSVIHKDENTPLLNFANENPLGIKIIEITKPEEIRITDDKPKAFIPKFATTTTSTTTAQSPKIEEVTKTQTTESSSIAFSESTTTDKPTTTTTTPLKKAVDFEDSNQEEPTVNSNEREFRDYMDDGTNVDDKIPGVAAPPTNPTIDGEVEPELSLAGADSNTIGDESSNKSVRQTVENSTSIEVDHSPENSNEFFSSTMENDFDSLNKEVSTTSTENDEVVAMAVTHMPKNIVIVRQGGKTESFHILGTDGLQRVEELDVLSSTTEGGQEDISEIPAQSSEHSSIETVTNDLANDSTLSTTDEPSSSESSSVLGESFEDDHTVAITVDKKLDNTLQSNGSTTEHSTKNSIEVSTPSDTVTENISKEVHETVFYEENDKSTELTLNDEPIDTSFHGPTENEKDGTSTTEASDYSSSTLDSTGLSTSEQSAIASTIVTEAITTTPRTSSVEPCVESVSRTEDEESTLAENPEFPYIPDDVSIHCKQIEEEEKHRLPSKEFHSSTESNAKRESLVGLASSEMSTISPSDEEMKKSHTMDLVEARAPGEPLLIPEWERNTTDSPLSMESSGSGENQTNDIHKTSIWDRFSFEISKENQTGSGSAEKSTSSSEEKYGNKEPTTGRPTTRKYADVVENEDGDNVSMSSEQSTSTDDTLSPKDDAESIKFNSEGESSAPIASYEGPSFKFIDLAMKDSWRAWAKENGWPF